jgi:hypothetical protein
MSQFSNIKKGIYRHNKKGSMYEVLGVALHTEENEPLVIYRPLDDAMYELFARPYDMFTEIVETDGKMQPRFEYVSKPI